MLHHNNALAHTALNVKQFLVSKEITMLLHPPYLPDLAPCDFFFFPKLKGILKGTHFQDQLDEMPQNHHKRRIFTELQSMVKKNGKVHQANGEYFEGDK